MGSTQNSQPHDLRTISFVSLGCPKNLVDSEKMLGLLASDGMIPVSAEGPPGDWEHDDAESVEGGRGAADALAAPGARTATARGEGAALTPATITPADVVVINTCGFLEAAKEESLAVIREAVRAKQSGAVKRVVVAGCLVQRHRAKLLEWEPGIDAMVGVFDRDKVVEAVRGSPAARRESPDTPDAPRYWIAANALQAARDRGLPTVGLTVAGKDGKGIGYFEDDRARLRLTPRHYAYLRISEGCNQACAFCTIPGIRGKMRSKPVDAAEKELRELLADGAFEINLIGQDTTSFGDDIGAGWQDDPVARTETAGPRFQASGGLPMLLERLDQAAAAAGSPCWLRLMYAYPTSFRDEFVDAFAEIASRGRLLPYIDMPLQHASDRMLQLMRRNVTASAQLELVRKLRDRIPGMALRTTFITGFPGETEEDHETLLAFVEEVAFDAVGVFEYSREEGTPAGTMERDPSLAVPPEVKRRRKSELLELQRRIAFDQAAYLAEQFDLRNPADTGLRFDVLIDRSLQTEGPRAAGVGGRLHQGRCYFQAPSIDSVTYVRSRQALSPGELVRCVIVGSDGYDLVARPADEVEKKVSLSLLR